MRPHGAIVAVAACVCAAALQADLVTYFPFDGDATDASGHGNDGVVHGATLTVDRFGNPDHAYAFDGSSYISASASILPTAERTVALWFRADSVDGGPTLLGYGGLFCGESFFMGLNAGPIFQDSYYVSSHCLVNSINAPWSEPPIGEWTHFAVTTSPTGTTIYVGGHVMNADANFIANTYVDSRDLAIGVDVSAGGVAPYVDANITYFVGDIDDVRIYDTALSEEEIQALAAPPCIGDLNADGAVDAQDLGVLLGAWGASGAADLDGDGTVSAADLGVLLGAWGPCG